jgi:hypothetical protein
MAFQFNPFTGTFDIVLSAGMALPSGGVNSVLFVDNSSLLVSDNARLAYVEATHRLQIFGSGYYSYDSLQLAAASGVGAIIELYDDGTGSWFLGQTASTGNFALARDSAFASPYLTIDRTSGLVSIPYSVLITNDMHSTTASVDDSLSAGSFYLQGGVTGQIFYAASDDEVISSANLFWDNVSSELGINTNSPNASLDCRGTAIFNENGADYDFRIEGDNEANLFVIDASTDRVGIGTGSPSNRYHVYYNQSTPLAANTYATFFEGRYNPNNNAPTYFLGAMTVQSHNYSGTYTVEDVRGLFCVAGKAQAGGVTTAMAASFYVNNENSSNSIGTAYSIYVYQPYCAAGGSIGTMYGIWMGLQKRTGVTTGYGIYQSGTADLNVFAGSNYFGAASSPSAKVHIAAGTATASTAPLKFTAGTNLTAAEAGAMEWDGTNLYITQTAGAVRKTLAYVGGTESRSITFVLDGGGSAITTGEKGWVRVPYACTITGWEITADVSGSIVIDVWKDTYANYPPDVSDTIAGTEKPTLSSATKNQDLTLTTWTTAVSAGDYIKIKVDSVATVTKVSLSIIVTI